MRAPTAIALSFLFQLQPVSAQQLEDNLRRFTYPETRQVNVTEKHFDQTVIDSYRWLENEAPADHAVAAWIEVQNTFTRKHLDSLPGREAFRERIRALHDYERYTVPRKRGDRYFFNVIKGEENQPSLYVRDGVFGNSRVLIDPGLWSKDGEDALMGWSVSDDAQYVAFAIQKQGSDWRTIKVLDVESGKELPDALEGVRFSHISWAPDGSGFFYSRMPRPKDGTSRNAPVGDHSVYYHRLGTAQVDDRVIYSTPERPELLHGADRVTGGRYLTISSTPGTNESALTVIDLEAGEWKPRTVITDMDSSWYVLGNHGSKLLLATTQGAERGRIVSLEMDEAKPEPEEIIAEDPNGAVLDSAVLAGETLLVNYQRDVKTEIRRFTMDGRQDGSVDLPGVGTGRFLEGDAAEAFFVFTSYDAPIAIYRYDMATRAVTPWVVPKVPIDLDGINVEQTFYHSKDGTKIPLFLVRRNDVTGAAPTLLYGYGGFGISQIPIYNPINLAWVEQGGTLAVANIRGGGEYGKAWHRAGQLEHKQNSFDDFIAAAEFLKRTGITSRDGLAIQGESGGGLLVSAVTNQRPDLIDVALPGVAVTDMLRYDKFTGGGLWKGEFGSPAEERYFRNLMTYSPYHTIRQGKDYPAILATTADADDRVVPAHTFKYIAALQAADLGPKPRLVRIETRAGHGAGMPIDKVIDQYADMWAFAAYWAGLKTRPVK